MNQNDYFGKSLKLWPVFLDHYSERRRNYPPYKALLNASRHAGDKGEYQRAKMLRLQAQQMPSRDPEDPDFRRLWYVRYADDFLLGFSGPKHEAEEIKRAIRQFLHDTLKLEMSTEKTLITHARTEAARFLGYDVVTLDAMTRQDHRGQRCINGAVRLKIPIDVIRQQCQKYMRNGKPSHRPERLYNDDYSIVAQYQAEYRGFVQYYLMGFNAHRLWNVHRVMRKSLLGTLANKHRTTVSRIVRSLRTEVTVGDKTIKALQIVRHRGQGKRPLVATFGGLSLAWQKDIVISDNPKPVFNGFRSELISRLLAQTCECCGSNDGPFEVHHVRKLSDLSQRGRKEKPRWLRIMASRHRKTLVVCRECHQNIHRTIPVRHREI